MVSGANGVQRKLSSACISLRDEQRLGPLIKISHLVEGHRSFSLWWLNM
jgi:hypothetical protein